MPLLTKINSKWAGYKTDYSSFHKTAKYALALAAMAGSAGYAGYTAAVASGGAVSLTTSGFTVAGGAATTLALAGTLALTGAYFVSIAAVSMAALSGLCFLRAALKNGKPQNVQNKAGQSIEGPAWAINRLQKAQEKVSQLTASFNTASELPEEAKQAVAAVVSNLVVERAQKAVRVPNAPADTPESRYKFVREKRVLEQVG